MNSCHLLAGAVGVTQSNQGSWCVIVVCLSHVRSGFLQATSGLPLFSSLCLFRLCFGFFSPFSCIHDCTGQHSLTGFLSVTQTCSPVTTMADTGEDLTLNDGCWGCSAVVQFMSILAIMLIG